MRFQNFGILEDQAFIYEDFDLLQPSLPVRKIVLNEPVFLRPFTLLLTRKSGQEVIPYLRQRARYENHIDEKVDKLD